MTCKEKLKQNRRDFKATLATNFYNYETLKALLLAAKETDSSLILQTSESTLKYLGLKTAVALARSMLADYEVEGWLHLDHGSSIEIVKRCLDAGYDSVMIDASEQPLHENIEITKQTVQLSSSYSASVEAELGYIAKLGQNQAIEPTAAADAKRFSEETGINALAVAIGNAHGFYKETPNLRLDRLKEIREATDCALVLHGSSGIPDEQIQKAVRLGINKINLATETKNTFMKKLQLVMRDSTEIDLRKVFPMAINEVAELIKHKMELVKNASIA